MYNKIKIFTFIFVSLFLLLRMNFSALLVDVWNVPVDP